MKKILKITLCLFIFSLFINISDIKADHIAGSDISWTCVGTDSFMIKMTIYRDCNGIAMSNENLAVNCKATGSNILNKTMAEPTGIDITPTCGNSCTRCQNSGCSFPYGIQQYTYQGLIVLSGAGSCCEVILSYSSCCRSADITTGMTWASYYCYAMLNRCITPCSQNNSPYFTNYPIAILCIGEDFVYNNGGNDLNVNSTGGLLDSLVYEWTSPLGTSINDLLSYTGQYTYDKPIYFWGFPDPTLPFPRGIHLDPNTGDISFRPMKIEVTVTALKISEYRNGNLIGLIRRDLQIIVINCPNNHPPTLGPAVWAKTVCAGQTVTFTITTNDLDPTDTDYISWNHGIPGASWSDNNGSTKHPTGTFTWTPGLNQASNFPYSFTVTAKDNACPVNGLYTHSYQVTVNPIPAASYTAHDSGCGNYWFTAHATKGNGPVFTWTGQSFSFSPNTGALTHYHFTSPGKYPYTMTITAQGCSQTYYDTVKVDSYLQIVPFKNKDVCKGTPVTLTANYKYNRGAVKYKWSTSASDTAQTKSFPVTMDTSVTAIIIDTLKCVSTGTININMHNFPTVNIGPDIRICAFSVAGDTVKYSFDQSALKTIKWTEIPGNTVISMTNIALLTDSGTYMCLVTDTLGCKNSDTLKVAVNPQIVASAQGTTICFGQKTDLNADATGSKTANVIYKWYNGATLLGNGQKITVQPAATTDYTLKVSETTGGIKCKDSVQVMVKVNLLPVIKISAIPQRCIDGAVLLLNSYVTVDGNSNAGGTWSSPSSGLVTADRFDPVASGSGIFKVKYAYTNPATGCYNADSGMVTINPLPVVNAGKDDSLCTGGGSMMLGGKPAVPPGIWSGTGVSGSAMGYIFDPTTAGIINGGIYPLIYKYTDNKGCINEDTMNITVFKTPVAEAGPNIDVCEKGAVVSLSGTPAGGTWTGTGVVGGVFDPVKAGVGSYQLTYTYTNIICTASDKLTVTVHALPTLTVQTADGKNIYCNNNGLVDLTGTPGGGTWSGTGVSGTTFDPSICTGSQTTYGLTYTYTDKWGCVNSKVLNITVRPAPTVTIDKTQNKFCIGVPFQISATYTNADGVLWWKSPQADGSIPGSTTSTTIDYLPGTNDKSRLFFWLYIETTHLDNVCQPAFDSIKVAMSAMPDPEFRGVPKDGCAPLTVTFKDSTTITLGTVNTWSWTFGDGQTSKSENPQHVYTEPGVYTVTLKVMSDAGCSQTLEKDNYIYSRVVPEAAFIPMPEITLISVPTIKFNNTTTGTEGTQYYWNFGDPKVTGGGTSTLTDPEYKYSDTGKYDVKLRAINDFGSFVCSDSMVRRVIIMPDVIAYIPTAFRPLGKNTKFKVYVDGIISFDLKVYSRWGELMYESTDYETHGWEGTYLNSSKEAPLGVYVYALKLKGLDGLDYKYSGTVTLLK